MKRIAGVIVVAALILSMLAGCTGKDPRQPDVSSDIANLAGNSSEDIILTIKSIDPKNCLADLSVSNKSGQEVRFGERFFIQVKQQDSWKELERVSKNISWNAVAFPVEPKGEWDCTIHWESIYGPLKSGEYRIVKDYISGSEKASAGQAYSYCVCEFTVKD